MFKILQTIVLCFLVIVSLEAQTIIVQPYLQDAEPNSIRILWETSEGTESTVEWGSSEALGNTTSGTSATNQGVSQIHDVQLTGLTRFTDYYYQVKTGSTTSEIYKFKTPPFAADKESFRMIAMSDMQRDGSHPDKFREVVEEGVMQYIADQYEGEFTDNVALVVIPGDLVATGSNYGHWTDQFFAPSSELLSQVPLYPVLGNHEANTIYYFNYFHLPENGTAGFEEHWWFKDYSNTRIIGLNSNSPYDNQTQLDWLDNVLESSCTNDSIDFVFAQLHHPHKSELWLPGESDFTEEVIARLESFSTECGKPSIHFFGHTHGYSRGQSRDHKHLWINVATAGGAIDHWGDYPQFDYDEFTVSHEEWGFVEVSVEAGEEPSFTVKRISRGNEAIPRNNEVRDSFTIKLANRNLPSPTPIFPINETVSPHCIVLNADGFIETTTTGHGASHWQVSTDCTSFSTPIVERWKNHENWYFNINTQAEDDLTDERVMDLDANTDYCWRVRYRDQELNWSEWSAPSNFTTGESDYSANLLTNEGAESDLLGWTAVSGVIEALTDGECDGISPYLGEKYFAVGGVCEDGAYGKAMQLVNLSSYTSMIDDGNLQANYGGFLSNYNGTDLPEMKLYFLDANEMILDSSATISNLNSSWTRYGEWADIPIGTRAIQFTMIGTRNGGSDNDSYFEELFLRVGTETSDCDEFISSVSTINNDNIQTLEVHPNPVRTTAIIPLGTSYEKDLTLEVVNIMGQKVNCKIDIQPNEVTIERGNLAKGIYFLNVYKNGQLTGKAEFMMF